MRSALCFLLIGLAWPLFGDNTIAYAAPGLWYDGFVTANASQPISEKTRFQVTWDEKNLYIEIDMGGKHLKKNKEYKYRADLWPRTESVEVFLDPAGTQKTYFQVVVSKDGVHYDSRGRKNPEFWKKPKWKAENIIDKDGHWRMRFIFPFDAPGMKRPVIGDTWYFNVCRNIVSGMELTSVTWANVGRKFHNPSKFARLGFGTPAQYKAVKNRSIRKKLDVVVARAKKSKLDQAYLARIRKTEQDLSDRRVVALADELEVIEAICAIK